MANEIISGPNSILVVANGDDFAIQLHNKNRYYGWIFRRDGEGWLANSVAARPEVELAKSFLVEQIQAKPSVYSMLRPATGATVLDKPERQNFVDDLEYNAAMLIFRVNARRASDAALALKGERNKGPWPAIHEKELIQMVEALLQDRANQRDA